MENLLSGTFPAPWARLGVRSSPDSSLVVKEEEGKEGEEAEEGKEEDEEEEDEEEESSGGRELTQ